VYAGLALFVLGVWTIAPKLYVGRAQSEYFAFARAGDYLHQEAAPGDLAFLEPIGLIGWTAPVRIMDEVGLVTPDVARRRMRGPGWYADVVHDASPRWLVIRRGVRESGDAYAGRGAPFRSSVERDSVFAHYQLATEFDTSSGAAALQIWKHVR
jgi:hypothetical protein